MQNVSRNNLISITADERDFILELCNGNLEIDLELKLRMGKISPQDSIMTTPFSQAELFRLVNVLHRKSENKVISFGARDWAKYLADKLAAQSSGVAAA